MCEWDRRGYNSVTLRDDLLKLMEQHFSLVRRVIEVLLERIRYATIFSQNLAFLSASERIAAALVHADLGNLSSTVNSPNEARAPYTRSVTSRPSEFGFIKKYGRARRQ